jgi:phosphotransferase system HPr (HPr) family protein
MSNIAIRRVRLNNVHGLHLRPAMALSQHAQRFSCIIHVSCGERRADAKSILDLIALTAEYGSELVFEAHGPNSSEALDSLELLVLYQFQELQSGAVSLPES